MWKALCSRKLALYALLALIVPLIASTILPSEMTLSEQQWDALQSERPLYYLLASRCATPYIVKTPYFAAVSALLFLSTFACTWQRVRARLATRNSDFSREKCFSFSRVVRPGRDVDGAKSRIEELLASTQWKRCPGEESKLVVTAEKGRSGFWGSVVFHAGLLCCLLAGPVTLLTGVKGELVLTEGVELPLTGAVAGEGRLASLPQASVAVHDLKGRYFQGQFKEDFSGALTVRDGDGHRELAFAVNKPVLYRGFQFSLHQFGYAPRVVIDGAGAPFDCYLNLRHPQRGDSFDLGDGVTAFVLFFPDFIREGGKVGSKSREAVNPVTLIKLFRGEREVFKGLFKPGEEALWEGKRIRVPEFRQWVTLIVAKEQGVLLVIVGSLVGAVGLLVRFLSNERRIEFELSGGAGECCATVRGYSRYYPAFLEKEVLEIAKKLEEGEAPVPGIAPERAAGCEVA